MIKLVLNIMKVTWIVGLLVPVMACGSSSTVVTKTQPTNMITPIVTALCSDNTMQQPLYFSAVPDALPSTLKKSTATSLQPYWDVRYTNTISPLYQYANHLPYSGVNSTTGVYNKGVLAEGETTDWGTIAASYDPSGSNVQTTCIGGYLTASAMINGWDALDVKTFGGPQATWGYVFDTDNTHIQTDPKPWDSNGGNLMLQGIFKESYHNNPNAIGGQLNFNVFLSNPKVPGSLINFVISVSRSNNDMTEGAKVGVDPTTGAAWVSTLIKDGAKWVTKSPYSESTALTNDKASDTQSWTHFYRVNISYADLSTVLVDMGSKTSPADWVLTQVSVQTEITGDMDQSMGTSVRAFEVYKTRMTM